MNNCLSDSKVYFLSVPTEVRDFQIAQAEQGFVSLQWKEPISTGKR